MTDRTDDPAPMLLSDGNPPIPKGDGDGPVEAYPAAMPGWKRDVGRKHDALVVEAVPGVKKPSGGTPPSTGPTSTPGSSASTASPAT